MTESHLQNRLSPLPLSQAERGEAAVSSHADHERAAANVRALGFAVITLSDTRTEETDASGRLIRDSVGAACHRVARYAIVKDDPDAIRAELLAALDDPEVAIVVTNGGTGIALRDSAYETISALLDKRLDGFGELFRMLSYQQIGAAAMLSRAVAGIARGKVVFSLPGSTKAVQLGLEKLILPQAAHLYYELHK
jgi:molybdenum cofactor biosynthesis protein B